MAEIYSSTTTPNPKASCCLLPSEHLEKPRFFLKVAQVLLSFVAFVLEESVSSCISCTPLYFFEFVSCTAVLFTLLLLILLATTLHQRVGITCWPQLDFVYTGGITVFLFISSITFAADNTGSTLESTAVAFGFLATVAFAGDVGYFLKERGHPFDCSRTPKEPGNSQPVTAEPATTEPETEKLTAAVNGGE